MTSPELRQSLLELQRPLPELQQPLLYLYNKVLRAPMRIFIQCKNIFVPKFTSLISRGFTLNSFWIMFYYKSRFTSSSFSILNHALLQKFACSSFLKLDYVLLQK